MEEQTTGEDVFRLKDDLMDMKERRIGEEVFRLIDGYTDMKGIERRNCAGEGRSRQTNIRESTGI